MLLIGNENCGICKKTAKLFDKNGIEYEYILFNELSDELKEKYKEMSRKKGNLSFPIIVLGNEVVTAEEVLNRSKEVLHVIKRNGSIAIFQEDRIINAIDAALRETSSEDDTLGIEIAAKIKASVIDGKTTVEDIQDMVENELMSSNRKDVAKRYILYREVKNVERNLINKDESTGLLSDEFVSKYKHAKAPFTPFGEFIYVSKYSRWLPHLQRREFWYETVRRAVEYNCSILKTTRREAEELYDNIFNLKQFLSGRTFWTGGTAASKLFPMSNFNCAFTVLDNFKAFEDIFYSLMVGAGVGFRILFSDVNKLPKVRTDIKLINEDFSAKPKSLRDELTSSRFENNICTITIGDSKEGWTDALSMFLKLFYSPRYRVVDTVVINYNNIRPFGEKLKIFGGTASGYDSMKNMLTKIHKVITKDKDIDNIKKQLKTIDVLDIANIIAENVVSGGVRRSAQICLFDPKDTEVLESKSKLYTQDATGAWKIDKSISHRQMSNNSVYYESKPSREQIKWQLNQMRYNGEPAFINGAAIRKRREDGNGVNPCGRFCLK